MLPSFYYMYQFQYRYIQRTGYTCTSVNTLAQNPNVSGNIFLQVYELVLIFILYTNHDRVQKSYQNLENHKNRNNIVCSTAWNTRSYNQPAKHSAGQQFLFIKLYQDIHIIKCDVGCCMWSSLSKTMPTIFSFDTLE